MKNNIEGICIAIVGGCGLIGTALAIRLKELNANVNVIDSLEVNNYLSFHGQNNEVRNNLLYQSMIGERLDLLRKMNIQIHIEDARDYHRLALLIDNISPQVIIHLAAVAHANRSNKDPHSTFDHSLRTLENSLDIARFEFLKKNRDFQLIYLSSSMVYGDFNSCDVNEESTCDPLGIYGALKYSGEKLVIAYNQVFDLPFTIIRPSAVYGELDVGRRVGQIFIENAMRGLPLLIEGDGSDRLDFTYVQDLASGLINVIENSESKNKIFNITYGQSRSLKELAEIVQKYFPNTEIIYKKRDSLMPERGTLLVDKARKLIGYEPEFPLERGFKRYIDWYKSMKCSEKIDLKTVFIT